MPQVPAYSLPQETERALPGARVESIASPALLDAGAAQAEQFGQSLTGAAAAGAFVVKQMEEKQITADVFQNMAALKGDYIKWHADVTKARVGNASKGVTNDTATFFKDYIGKASGPMQNTRLKELFFQHATTLQLQSVDSMSKFEAVQTAHGQDQDWKAGNIASINLAAADPTQADAMVSQIRQANIAMGIIKKWSPQVLKVQTDQDFTNLHKQVIQTMAAGDNKALASAYFKEHESEIQGADRAELGKYAQQATAMAMGAEAAQTIWSATVKDPRGEINIFDMTQKMREQFKDNTWARDAAIAQIHQMKADLDAQNHSANAANLGAINQLFLDGKSLAAVMQTPAWTKLSPSTQQAQVLHYEQVAATREGRAAARESRAYTAGLRAEHELNVKGWDTMERLSTPQALMAIKDRNDVLNLRTTIGTDNTQKLLQKWDTWKGNEHKLTNATVDNDRFNEFATDAGLKPGVSYGKDRKMAVRVSTLRDRIETMIGEEQLAKRRELTRNEKDDIMRKEIDNKVIRDVFGPDSWRSAVPAISLTPSEAASAYVMVNGEEVKLSSIPKTDRAQIISARRAEGLPVSEQAIAEMWVKKNKKVVK